MTENEADLRGRLHADDRRLTGCGYAHVNGKA